jgi:hypothetical protein
MWLSCQLEVSSIVVVHTFIMRFMIWEDEMIRNIDYNILKAQEYKSSLNVYHVHNNKHNGMCRPLFKTTVLSIMFEYYYLMALTWQPCIIGGT